LAVKSSRVVAQQAKAGLETHLVLLGAVRIDLTPIAFSVPIKKFLSLLARLFES
jgi:hypothetical protein